MFVVNCHVGVPFLCGRFKLRLIFVDVRNYSESSIYTREGPLTKSLRSNFNELGDKLLHKVYINADSV